jgi:starch phosphorylase
MKDSLSEFIFEHERVASYMGSIKQFLANCLTNSVGKDTITVTDRDRFFAAAYMVRNRILDALLQHGDKYMLLKDYASYIACQKRLKLLTRIKSNGYARRS